MTVKHWLEAIVGQDTRFQVVCEDVKKCAEEQGYTPGFCTFVDQFKDFGVDMIEWGVKEEDIVIGKIEVKADWETSKGEHEAWLRRLRND